MRDEVRPIISNLAFNEEVYSARLGHGKKKTLDYPREMPLIPVGKNTRDTG